MVKTIQSSPAIGPGTSQLQFIWDGSQDSPLTGTAPKGVYLFRWEVGSPGPTMDYDTDKSGTLITATHGEGGANAGYAALFHGPTWLCGAPSPPAPKQGVPIDYISQAGAVPYTVILTGCQTGQNHQDPRSLMGACRAKGVPNRGGQLFGINFVRLRIWHVAFAESIREQVKSWGTWSALEAAQEATKKAGRLRGIDSLTGGLPSPFIFNEQVIDW